MKMILRGGPLTGSVHVPPSKSQLHRLLLCAALGDTPSEIYCGPLSLDVRATAASLAALGASIRETEDGRLFVIPGRPGPGLLQLPCGESGSTLRFLLPVAAALGTQAAFSMAGRLPQRPLQPLAEQLTSHGVTLRQEGHMLICSGRLQPGADYVLPGDVSSQFISGLLFALPLLAGNSTLTISGATESLPYITMTESALQLSGIVFEKEGQTYHIPGRQTYCPPASMKPEGDWSGAAFFLCSGALGGDGITCTGLDQNSLQGDRAVTELLERFGARVLCTEHSVTVCPGALHAITVDAAPIPDLIPALCAVAALADGDTCIRNAARLRLKESDRIRSLVQLLHDLGGNAEERANGLIIHGSSSLTGGTVNPCGDHRIAMAAAAAACGCRGTVTVKGAQCVDKSYPCFWRDRALLKGGSL